MDIFDGFRTNSILNHSSCKVCVWGEDGFYNSICAHCPYCLYGKKEKTFFMTRDMAESLGLVKPIESAE